MKTFLKSIAKITLVLVGVVFMTHHALVYASAPKISISPSSVTLPENSGSQTFSLSLTNPIIVTSGDPNVVVTLTSSDLNVSISPSTVTFLHDQWFTPQSFTVTTSGTGIANPYDAVTIGLTAASGSVYYNGYTASVVATLIDGDRTAPTLTEVTPIPDQVSSPDATYHFSTSGDTTNYEVITDCPDGTMFNIADGTVSFHDLVVGQTYGDCNFGLQLNLYPSSNVLHINPFTAVAPAAPSPVIMGLVSGGSSDVTWTPQTGFVHHTVTSSNGGLPQTISTSALSVATPKTSSRYHFTKLLKKGMNDPQVIDLQKYLASKGFEVVPQGHETSMFGSQTKIQLARFQKSVGIKPTGVLGSMTQSYINSHE